ncbi:helix-turn-helix domain-containing protein [Sporichthya sp.]|uniref:helix-turn-helix domain-containing protein n=1 Tax=Sporichthya sp. TaxID=65475 RepID=UPI0017F3A7BC|nr:helix-turn-helix domain-containing protein [Sporichthya sp.]MBA3744113.1 helix-turn-helix domain-containing protein [Sporichthya sp.]
MSRERDLSRGHPRYKVELDRLANALVADLEGVSAAVVTRVLSEIPELGRPDSEESWETTMASGLGNIGALMSMMTYGVPANAGIEPPEGALEFFRTMISRGADITTILRAYRIGHAELWNQWMKVVSEGIESLEDLPEIMTVSSAHMFGYMDSVCERLVAEYEPERRRQLTSAAALRVATAQAIVAGEDVDADQASQRLNYRLRRHHLALVLWPTSRRMEAQGTEGLERTAFALAEELGTEGPLLVPASRGCVWAWLGAADARRLAPVIAAKPPPAGVAVAAGAIGYGLDGFRESHRQAGEARRVCGLRDRPPTDIVHYRTVSLISALSTDPSAAQRFLVSELGELNAPEESTRRLRTTLRTFLEVGSSHARAARVLGIHQKTVAYRVHRAEDLLGYRVVDRRAPLEAALLLSAFLED